MQIWWVYPVIASFLLAVVLTDVFGMLARGLGVVDRPNGGKKQHAAPTPLLGGLGIFVAVNLVVFCVLFLSDHFTAGEITNRHFLGLFLGALILMIGGALDDVYDLPPYKTVWFPIVAALVAVCFGLGVEKVTNPLGGAFMIPAFVSDVVTFLWLLCLMYTTKLLDGLDGLATGISALGVGMIALLALSVAYFQPDVALLALIVLAALVGFLLWNAHPAQIFLGEGGSTLVGFLVGALAVISGGKFATALLVLGIPALDVMFVMVGRWRLGKPIFAAGDRTHLHHRLMALGLTQRQVVALYYAIALIFGITTLFFESWQKLIALIALFILMLLFALILPKPRTV